MKAVNVSLPDLTKLTLSQLSEMKERNFRLRKEVLEATDFLASRVGESKVNIEDWLVESYAVANALNQEISKRVLPKLFEDEK